MGFPYGKQPEVNASVVLPAIANAVAPTLVEGEAVVLRVKQDLTQAKAALMALKDAHAKETADHCAALGEMKAQYKFAEKAERDAIAQLVLARNAVKQEVSALVEAIKELV